MSGLIGVLILYACVQCVWVTEMETETPKCKAKVDVGFILDSSGSLRDHYHKEKTFLKDLAGAFGISEDGTRASVLTFSYYSQLSIKFKDHFDQASFDRAVDAIPLMGSTTRIDKAFRLTQSEMFKPENGARPHLPKILILLTDGSQTKDADAEDPGHISDEMRAAGISIIVIGVGSGTDQKELDDMAGGPDNAFSAASFDELVGGDFIKQLTDKSCEVATGPTCKAKVDVGFLLDSSGSLKADYQKEKDFLKALAGTFGISEDGSRASVITFSYYSELSIKFKDHFDQASFDRAVDEIPLMDSTTRIDKAFRLTQSEMFKPENGARTHLPKILILLTDGSQTKDADAEDPGHISDEMRAAGISIIVIGVGSGTDENELDDMAGGNDKAFSAASFDELIGGDFVSQLKIKSCEEAEKKPEPKCKEAVDVGFILDSSGSLRNDYHREKVFLKELAGAFGISEDGSRASVLTFSYYSELSIKFKDYFDQDSFNDAVDAIQLMGGATRIDKAFRRAQSEMFKPENGARPNLAKILILLTDGSQTRDADAEDPGDISDELRASGITIIVVGIGSGTNKKELDDMAGGKDNAFSAVSFDELVDGDFIEKLTYKSCEVGKKPSPADDWTLLQNHVCFGNKGDAYGSFKTTRNGDLSGLKFIHESGYISCVAGDSRNSNWGCDGYGVGVVVTDMKNNHILTKNERSLLASKSSQDPSLILNVFLKVKKDEEFRIWEKEDLKNRGEWNNHGTVCATVYGKFKA